LSNTFLVDGIPEVEVFTGGVDAIVETSGKYQQIRSHTQTGRRKLLLNV
jgi:hypothetical protein